MALRIVIITTLLLWGIIQICFAQEHQAGYVDSLTKEEKKALTDTAKARILFLLSDYWALYDSAKGVNYATQALQLNLNTDYKGLAFFYLGNAYFDNDNNKASEFYSKAIDLLEPLRTKEALLYQSRAWANRGAIMQRRSNNRAYIDALLNHAIPLAIKAGDSIRAASQYMDLGLPFMNYKEYDKALFYFKKSADILKRHQVRSLQLSDCYLNIARVYLKKNTPEQAKPYLDSANNILHDFTPGSFHISYYVLEAMYQTYQQNWKEAEAALYKAQNIAKTINDPYQEVTILYGFISLYHVQKNWRQLKAVVIQLQQKEQYLTAADKALVWLDRAIAEKELGNANEAYDWLAKSKMLSDSLNSEQTTLQITELETRYNFLEKEKQVLLLNERNRWQQFLLLIILILMFAAAAIFFYIYKQRKKKAQQEVLDLQQKQQIEIAQALLLGEERERKRLAQDLHDGLGGLLASVKINMSGLAAEDNPRYKKVVTQIDSSVTELRRIAHNMMPESLLRMGLETAIKDLCELVNGDTVSVEFQALNINAGLPENEQIIIYRIIQELLANVVKHSGATEVFLQCSQFEDSFYITIEDNGHGFNEKMNGSKKGIGLQNIQTRVSFLKGKIDIQSSQKGTNINIELKCSN